MNTDRSTTSSNVQGSFRIQSDGANEVETAVTVCTSAPQGMQYATVSAAAAGKTPLPVDSSVHYQEVDHKASKVTDLVCSSTSTCNLSAMVCTLSSTTHLSSAPGPSSRTLVCRFGT